MDPTGLFFHQQFVDPFLHHISTIPGFSSGSDLVRGGFYFLRREMVGIHYTSSSLVAKSLIISVRAEVGVPLQTSALIRLGS